MAFKNQREQGPRNLVDLRVGTNLPGFLGVNRSVDPGGIKPVEFWNLENCRMTSPIPFPIARGGQDKSASTQLPERIEGIHDASDIGAPAPLVDDGSSGYIPPPAAVSTCTSGAGIPVGARIFLPGALGWVHTYDILNGLRVLPTDPLHVAGSVVHNLGVDPARAKVIVLQDEVTPGDFDPYVYGIDQNGAFSVLFTNPSPLPGLQSARCPVKIGGSIFHIQYSDPLAVPQTNRIIQWDGSTVTEEHSHTFSRLGWSGEDPNFGARPFCAGHLGKLYVAEWSAASTQFPRLIVRNGPGAYDVIGTFTNCSRILAMYSDGVNLWIALANFGTVGVGGTARYEFWRWNGALLSLQHTILANTMLPGNYPNSTISFGHEGLNQLYYAWNDNLALNQCRIGLFNGSAWDNEFQTFANYTPAPGQDLQIREIIRTGSRFTAHLSFNAPAGPLSWQALTQGSSGALDASWNEVVRIDTSPGSLNSDCGWTGLDAYL